MLIYCKTKIEINEKFISDKSRWPDKICNRVPTVNDPLGFFLGKKSKKILLLYGTPSPLYIPRKYKLEPMPVAENAAQHHSPFSLLACSIRVCVVCKQTLYV